MPNDLAKHMCCYITTQVKKPNKIITAQYGTIILELSKYLTLLPCYKDKEGSPFEMEQANRKLTEMDICTAINSGLSQDLDTVY